MEKETRDNYIPFIVLCVTVCLVWWSGLLYLNESFFKAHSKVSDAAGVINALFAGLAFAGVIFTIHLQRKELKLQRHELSQTREEFEIQNDTLKKQRFENTFFQMISLHHEIVKNLRYEDFFDKIWTGRNVFEAFLDEFGKSMDKHINSYNTIPTEKLPTLTVEAKSTTPEELWNYIGTEYEIIFENNFANSFGHYFRNLYHIFKFIYLSDLIREDQRNFYASIVRAQLTENELESAVFNSLVEGYGYPKFTYLMQRFNIVKNINWKSPYLWADLQKLYESESTNVLNPFEVETTSS